MCKSSVMKSALRCLMVLLLLFQVTNSRSQILLPSIIGDNMVLQQQETVPLWGWDRPGQLIGIEVSWLDSQFETTCDNKGEWIIEVPTPGAGGPYEITLSGSEKKVLRNVMIGEVWLCSGQSNMEMPLKGWPGQPITGSEQAIASAKYPQIRLFTVTRNTSYEPLEDCEGSWAECSPENAGDFSATGYFFGLELCKNLGIPVGLIHSSWGGTPAEAWTSRGYIGKIPYFQTSPGCCDPAEFRQKKLDAYQQVQEKWLQSLGFLPESDEAPDWASHDYNDKYWEEIDVPAKWENTRLGSFQGMVEFRLGFKIPKKWTGKNLVLELGPIDEIDITWVNGVKVGTHPNPYDWATPRVYEIPRGVARAGKNILAIQVGNTSGAGGIFGEPGQLRIFPEGEESSARPVKGKWKARKSMAYGEIVDMPYCNNCSESNTPTTLYNGMINPLIPYRIKGAVWYQGESNRYDGELYSTIFPNMINCWRDSWGQGDFPFYYVQIAPYTYRDEISTGLVKESQQEALRLPNTGMVVTSDIGDLVTIHPPDKQSVGKRLAYWALAKNYGEDDLIYSGPLFREWEKRGSKIIIYFDHAEGGLKIEGPELLHIMIAGRNRKFVPARAEIQGETLVVFSPEIDDPAAVRFGWGNTDQTNLFNAGRLPAGPFRTDNWKE